MKRSLNTLDGFGGGGDRGINRCLLLTKRCRLLSVPAMFFRDILMLFLA